MTINIQTMGHPDDFLHCDYFPHLTCDICEERISDHRSAHAAWFEGEEHLYYVHTAKGCVDYLEELGKQEDKLLMTDTLINHFSRLLFLLDFKEGSVYPTPNRDEGE